MAAHRSENPSPRPPHAGTERAGRWRLPSHGASAGLARRQVREVLAQWDARADVVQDAVLAVSELVGNAVLHGGGPDVLLTLRLGGTRLRIEVQDGGPGWPAGLPGPCGADSEYGRGLLIVSRVAAAWGASPAPAGCGFLVWAELMWRRTAPRSAVVPARREAQTRTPAGGPAPSSAVPPCPRPAVSDARYVLKGFPLAGPALPPS